MSRSHKSKHRNRHSYINKRWRKWVKKNSHQRLRQEVHQQLKDVLFTDAFDEKELVGKKKAHYFDRWSYD